MDIADGGGGEWKGGKKTDEIREVVDDKNANWVTALHVYTCYSPHILVLATPDS